MSLRKPPLVSDVVAALHDDPEASVATLARRLEIPTGRVYKRIVYAYEWGWIRPRAPRCGGHCYTVTARGLRALGKGD